MCSELSIVVIQDGGAAGRLAQQPDTLDTSIHQGGAPSRAGYRAAAAEGAAVADAR